MMVPYDGPRAVGDVIALEPEIVAAILHTIDAGWMVASGAPDVHSGTGELTITERLRDGMRAASKTLPWGKSILVSMGTESRSAPGVTLPDGRTDIPIYVIEVFHRLREHDPHIIIECKRVAGPDTHLCREYVVEGIDRFRMGKYGRRHAIGLMAGYLLAGDAGSAAGGVNAYLSRARRGSEHLEPSEAVTAAWAWQSQHPRGMTALPIRLHHAFVTLRSAPH